jgi:hypothetical protein
MLDDVNELFPEAPYDKIENIRGINFIVRQAVSSNIGVVIGVGYLYEQTNTQTVTRRTVFEPQGFEVDHDYRLSTIPVSLGPELWYESGRYNFRACIAGILHFIQFEENTGENQDAGYSGYTKTFSGTSPGVDITLSAEWNPASIIFAGSRFGYGITGNAELTDDSNQYEPINADLSGYHISVYLAFAPWH